MSLRRLTGRFFHSSYRRGLSISQLFRPQDSDGKDASAVLEREDVPQTSAESQGTMSVSAMETMEASLNVSR